MDRVSPHGDDLPLYPIPSHLLDSLVYSRSFLWLGLSPSLFLDPDRLFGRRVSRLFPRFAPAAFGCHRLRMSSSWVLLEPSLGESY
jgi:hypothetical protein